MTVPVTNHPSLVLLTGLAPKKGGGGELHYPNTTLENSNIDQKEHFVL
jgi:hypothetical protein